MPIYQSPQEALQQHAHVPDTKGAVAAAIIKTAITGYTAGADIIAAGILPAFCQPLSMTLIADGFPAGTTAVVGLLTGEVNAKSDRTLPAENQIATGLDVAADNTAVVALSDLLGVSPDVTKNRSIGVTLNQNIVAADTDLTLVIEYAVMDA